MGTQYTLWRFLCSAIPNDLPDGLRFLSGSPDGDLWRVQIQSERRLRDSKVTRLLKPCGRITNLAHVSWSDFIVEAGAATFRLGHMSERGRVSVSRSPPKKALKKDMSESEETSASSIGLALTDGEQEAVDSILPPPLRLIEMNDETAWHQKRGIKNYAEQDEEGRPGARWCRISEDGRYYLQRMVGDERRDWSETYVIDRRSAFARPHYLPKSAEQYLSTPADCEARVARLRDMSCAEFSLWGFEDFPHPRDLSCC